MVDREFIGKYTENLDFPPIPILPISGFLDMRKTFPGTFQHFNFQIFEFGFFFISRAFRRRENSKLKKKNSQTPQQLTSRLAERDGQLSSLREEVELYDGKIQRLEDALDARTAELLALRRAAAEREEEHYDDDDDETPRQRQQQHPPSSSTATTTTIKTAAERFAAVSLTARAVDETLPPAPPAFAAAALEATAAATTTFSRPRSPAAAAPVAFVAPPPPRRGAAGGGGDVAGQDVLRRLLG